MDTSRIVKLSKKQGKSMTHLCKLIGKYRNYFNDVQNKNLTVPAEYLSIIANDLGTTVEYLTWQSDDPFPANQEKAAGKRSALRIPVLGRVPAGIPLEAIEDIIDFEEIPADMVRGDSEYFGLRVSGDSMYPKYLEGDIIIVRRQDTCENGQDCVVYVNGYDATLKTVYLLDNGGIRLQPVNPQYAPKTYFRGDEPVSIAGVVVELRRKII